MQKILQVQLLALYIRTLYIYFSHSVLFSFSLFVCEVW